MGYGLELYNADGVKTLSIQNRSLRFHSIVWMRMLYSDSNYGGYSDPLWVSGMTTDGTWHAMCYIRGVFVQVNNGYLMAYQAYSINIGNWFPVYIFRG